MTSLCTYCNLFIKSNTVLILIIKLICLTYDNITNNNNTIMDNLLNFYNNGHLVKCNRFDFDTKIKSMFENMFLSQISFREFDDRYRNKLTEITKNRHPQCLICSQRKYDDWYSGICFVCVKKMLSINSTLPEINNSIYIGDVSTDNYIKLGLFQRNLIGNMCYVDHDRFINQLHKLCDRYFH